MLVPRVQSVNGSNSRDALGFVVDRAAVEQVFLSVFQFILATVAILRTLRHYFRHHILVH